MANVKSYVELVNSVLQELREQPVTTVGANSYSLLVGKWVNDAKRQVEDAWDWQPLFYDTQFQLVLNQVDYDLTQMFPDLNARARLRLNPYQRHLRMAFDLSPLNPYNLIDRPYDWIIQTRNKMQVPQTSVQPVNFGLARYNNQTNDGIKMALWEYPQSVRTWGLYWTNPQDDLNVDTQPILVPWTPVVLIATDIALNERGEEIGEPGVTIDQRTSMHISNAIGVDSTFQEYNLEFYPD